ncbi:MAG: D-alanyl-D-alanine carboxypeptidase [Acidimicrobiia bacterium]|nr:D-alanyl-D-alanine carboxypeptidase [Acidimicrobiia bacterium]
MATGLVVLHGHGGTSEPAAFTAGEAGLATDEMHLAEPVPFTPSIPEIGRPVVWRDRPAPAVPLSTERAVPVPEPPPAATARRAVIVDATTGAVLWGMNEHEPAPVASTIKILTALTVRRFADDSEAVTVVEAAAAVGEREIYLDPGEVWSVKDLLGAMLVGSANDAAAALSFHVGGTEEGFGRLATWVAAELGARDTHVVNAHGLDQEGQVSTAYDLAVLARAALADPLLAELVRTPEIAFAWPGHEGPRVATNKNRLLRELPGGIGVKTGGTRQAGNCLVGAARRDGQTFIAVSLASGDPTADDMALLEWAFRNYSSVEVLPTGARVDGVRGRTAAPLVVTVPRGRARDVETDVAKGRVVAVLDGTELASVEVE